MNRFLIVFCFLLLGVKNHAQYDSGEVSYVLSIIPSKIQSANDIRFRDAKKSIEKAMLSLKFELKFNQQNSLFKLNRTIVLDNDEHFTKLAIIATRANRLIYTDLKENTILEKTTLFDKEFLIKSQITDIKWVLTKEYKKIDVYTCYKANGTSSYVNHKGEIKERNYVAWYTPEISFSFGPYESSGLPGLVLEYTNGKTILVASKINLSKNKIDIKIPNDENSVTKEEYNKIGKTAFENRSN